MSSDNEAPRVVATTLNVERIAGHTVVHGLDHDFETARIAAVLRSAGLDTRIYINLEDRTLAALARAVARDEPSVVIVRAPQGGPVGAWLHALRAACHWAHIVYIGESEDGDADIHLGVGDDKALLAALGVEPACGEPISPYLSRLVPPSAAARAGIDTIDRPAELVCAEVRLLERRTSGAQEVVVRGIVGDTSASAGLLELLRDTPRKRIRLVAEGTLAEFNAETVDTLIEAGLGARIVVQSADASAARLAEVCESFVAAQLPLLLHLNVDPAHALHELADVARTFAPGYTFALFGDDADEDDILDACTELVPGSSTAQALGLLESRAGTALQQLLCGARTQQNNASGAHAALWLDPVITGDQAEWLAQTLTLDAPTWSAEGATLAVSGDPATGAAAFAFGYERELEVIPYAAGRNSVPHGPLVLGLASEGDIAALLKDADEARRTGIFPTAVVHPLTAIADTVAFGGHGGGAPPQRLIVEDGMVRLGLGALPIASMGVDFATLVTRTGEEQERRELRRGCGTCPLAETCSRDGSLERLLSDEAYCEMRLSRPWLGLYVALPALVRRMLMASPSRTGRPLDASPRVSGFGGPLFHGELAPDTNITIVALADDYFVADAASGRCARLSADLAGIAEVLLATRSRELTAAWLTERRDISAEQALGAIGQALGLLDRSGMGAAVRVLLTDALTVVA